ncbi:MAG: prepilin-type N-terminal cleavage/methylation domain-containing protein [Candidatus Omnitrophota bacterium]
MKKGFTLLELLVVISVLIILIGIIIPRFRGMQDAGRIAQVKAELQTMQTAVEAYYTNQTPKAYPPTSISVGVGFLATATPQIINGTPPYDPWGAAATTEYNYVLSTNAKYYVISSVGVDGVYTTTLGISSVGVVTKDADDICVTNGSNC